MKQEEASFNTKKHLSATLKSIADEKPLAKITISELTEKCGVNRKTFYYHFHDITELLKWTLEQEAVDILKQYGRMNNFAEAIEFTVGYICKNKVFLSNICSSVGVIETALFFYNDFREAVLMAIDMHEKDLGKKISADFRSFLSDFYARALAGHMIGIFNGDITLSEEKLSEYIYFSLSVSLHEIISTSPYNDIEEIQNE